MSRPGRAAEARAAPFRFRSRRGGGASRLTDLEVATLPTAPPLRAPRPRHGETAPPRRRSPPGDRRSATAEARRWTAGAPSAATTCSVIRPTPSMATCGGTTTSSACCPPTGPEVRQGDRLSAQLAERDRALPNVRLEPFEAALQRHRISPADVAEHRDEQAVVVQIHGDAEIDPLVQPARHRLRLEPGIQGRRGGAAGGHRADQAQGHVRPRRPPPRRRPGRSPSPARPRRGPSPSARPSRAGGRAAARRAPRRRTPGPRAPRPPS